MNRRRLVISAIVLAVAVVALASPLWLPFFTNDVVDEAFPALSVAERESVRNMPEAQRESPDGDERRARASRPPPWPPTRPKP